MQTNQLVYSNKVNHILIHQKSVQPPKGFSKYIHMVAVALFRNQYGRCQDVM